MKQINHDYAGAKWPKRTHFRPGNMLGAWLVILVIFAVGLGLMLNASVRADSVIGVTTDNLMSPERAEYMVLFEHGQELDETDME